MAARKVLEVKSPVKRTHYQADACVFWCFDNDFSPAWEKFVAKRGFKKVDPVVLAGGAMWGAHKNKSWRKFLVNQAITSVKLHRTPLIILTTHRDCGGYGGSAAFGNDKKKEEARHRKDLKAAQMMFARAVNRAIGEWRAKGVAVPGRFIPPDVVRKTYPKKVRVEIRFVGMSGVWKIS